MKRRSTSSDPAAAQARRRQVASEAARLLADGTQDIAVARRKAAERLGIRDPASLPDADEIREALMAHRRLFAPGQLDPARLARQRRAALMAMEHFSDFEPRLAGPVLDGSAGADDPVILHLHADDPDAVARMLADRGAPARQRHRRLVLADGNRADLPCWELLADGQAFELWVLPASAARQAPRDPLGGGALPRASRTAVAQLLGADA
ncbi:hypothetical protein [Arenimonas donghaensis]|uniref:Uncharacterized protein n=1 Tax=Arenimonas donghaensis DSM 18148 = HO3-R19 TaxID=1121014 RepID=A0A087MG22_9GAMM|nr:hypothetical protein [Arenimonas donghaensis]KFL35825.1 hypothetical protein N788_07195 [Arenimonas donghaensis DSM 18148 = HO3-R19]